MATFKPSGTPHPLGYFPSLKPDNHELTSEQSRRYNCISWASGIDNKQIWPDGGEDNVEEPAIQWPKGIPNEETVGSFIAYFRSLGYETCDEPNFEEGFLKIAIFVKDDYPTHACRQLPSKKWTSKMGWDGVDIEHDNLDCIEGSQYGKATIYMKRAVEG